MESGRGFPTPSPAAEGGDCNSGSFEHPAPRSRQFCRTPYRALPSADNCVSGPKFFNPLALTMEDEAAPRALEKASFSAQHQRKREVVFTPSGGPQSLRRRSALTGNLRPCNTRRAQRSWQKRRVRESNALFWASWPKQAVAANGPPRQRHESTRPSSPALLASRMRFPLLSLASSPSKGKAGRPCSDPSMLIPGSGCWLALDDSGHSAAAPGRHGATRELRKPTPTSSIPALSVTVAVSKSVSTFSDALHATL